MFEKIVFTDCLKDKMVQGLQVKENKTLDTDKTQKTNTNNKDY